MKLKLLKTIAPIAGVATIVALPLSSCGETTTYTADIKAIKEGEYQRITEYKEPDSIDADEALSIYMNDVRDNPAIIFDDACEFFAMMNEWTEEVSGTVSITVTKARGARLSFIADANLTFLHSDESYQRKEEVRGRIVANNIKLVMSTPRVYRPGMAPWYINADYFDEDSQLDPGLLKADTKWSYTVDGVLTEWIGEEKVDYEVSSKFNHESDAEELTEGLGSWIKYLGFRAQYFLDIIAEEE